MEAIPSSGFWSDEEAHEDADNLRWPQSIRYQARARGRIRVYRHRALKLHRFHGSSRPPRRFTWGKNYSDQCHPHTRDRQPGSYALGAGRSRQAGRGASATAPDRRRLEFRVKRLTAASRLGIVRLDERQQSRPRHHISERKRSRRVTFFFVSNARDANVICFMFLTPPQVRPCWRVIPQR